MKNFLSKRPQVSDRKFTNISIEKNLEIVKAEILEDELSWMFENAYPNTPDTTVFYTEDASGVPDTYVITGDINAMWLRDSTAQVWPFIRLADGDVHLRSMLQGLIHRQARCLRIDAYANAFYRDQILGEYGTDLTEMRPGVHERKWELDSLASFVRLSSEYWTRTGDLSPFDKHWQEAFTTLLATVRTEQQGIGYSPYRYQRISAEGCSLPNYGFGDPHRICGLIRSAFRPSDDLCKLPYHVPSNAMLSMALKSAVPLLDLLDNRFLVDEAISISNEIYVALGNHALVEHPNHGRIWAYEIDGYGGRYLMDDANIPSLLALPYLGFSSLRDPDYKRTRAFCLSKDNPYFHRQSSIEGIGSPHTGHGSIWPLSLIMRALTSDDDEEIIACLRILIKSHAGTGFIHESFQPGNPTKFTRPWFAWANTLFGELIVHLWEARRHILQSKLL